MTVTRETVHRRRGCRRPRGAVSLLLLLVSATAVAHADSPFRWPEPQRAFLLDGPGLLLQPDQRELLVEATDSEREAWIADFLARDPVPETSENELQLGIERRALVCAQASGERAMEGPVLKSEVTRLLAGHKVPLSRITLKPDASVR